MSKPYTSKSLPSAIREVRTQRKLVLKLSALLDSYAKDRVLMAKLAAKTPQFDNPLVAMEAERIRDEILEKRR